MRFTRAGFADTDALTPGERDLVDALLGVVDRHGQFAPAPDGDIHPAYENPAENEDADIGVRCDNCAFYRPPGSCRLVAGTVEARGRCRFAVIPPGLVRPD